MKYNFKQIERKWQRVWAKNNYKIWSAESPAAKRRAPLPKRYVLDMFPYPSGEGLHVGHVEGYTASDIYSRYLRMKKHNVLRPMGWDAFGLPAENYAIKTKTRPEIAVKRNVKRFKKQLQNLGLSYDWQREINTTDPGYYKWTQWIFLQLFNRGLAVETEMPVNWCPSCKTVLANEEVIDGACERCRAQAEKKQLKQWVLKITAYADRLLSDLENLDWPQRVKEMQRNWIGKSEGATIKFRFNGKPESAIEVFTTRPDTLGGVSYVVLAPEHPLLDKKEFLDRIQNKTEVQDYIARARNRGERERQENKEKTGVELKNIEVINPLSQEKAPVWVADYVLGHYGAGAVMAVPAHDQRDFEFAQKFNLPIKIVVCPNYPETTCPILNEAHEGDGRLVSSGQFDGLPSQQAKIKIIEWLASQNLAQKKVNYKLRDWVFARQRYWGEPIPLVFCPNCKKNAEQAMLQSDSKRRNFSQGELINPGWIAVSEKDLPVKLPKIKSYQPTGKAESPLAAIKNWVNVKCPRCKGAARRETNTMPQWAGSNWYYIAYTISQKLKTKNQNFKWDKEKINYWLPVDVYVGGVEHAVLHLLYARFWHKVLYDIGIVATKEPFAKLVNQGLILGPDGQKMSKSRGNVVNPDEMVKNFGADSLRLYEMFMGPLEETKPWDPRGIVGMQRFLNRIWNLVLSANNESATNKRIRKFEKNSLFVDRLLHKTIKKVTEDIQNFHFNTAISALMILANELENQKSLAISDWAMVIKLLFPLAPHLSQELWQLLGKKTLLDYENWPNWNPKLIEEESFELIVQINGKLRAATSAKKGISESEAQKIALELPQLQKWTSQKIKKTIFVPDKLINFVI